MKSVRLDEALEARLREAARLSGKSVSQIIRQAIEEHCNEIVGQRLAHRLNDVKGVIRTTGGRARRTGRKLVESLRNRARRSR